MEKMLRSHSNRSRWCFYMIILCFLFCFTTAPLAATKLIYATSVLGISLTGPAPYHFSTGALNVTSYSKVRVNVSPIDATTAITVTVYMTDSAGISNLGDLETFTIDQSSGSATRVYDIPGKYIKISFQSDEAAKVTVFVFGN